MTEVKKIDLLLVFSREPEDLEYEEDNDNSHNLNPRNSNQEPEKYTELNGNQIINREHLNQSTAVT